VLLFDKIASVYFISEICFFSLALEMASQGQMGSAALLAKWVKN